MDSSLCENRTSRFEETIRSFDVRRSEAEGPLFGGHGRTFRLSGGRRRALQWAPPDPTCAGQRMNQEGSSPSGARMRGAVSKGGGNSSLAGRARRYGEV